MSTLSEIAANHAKMTKALAEKTAVLNEWQPQIVGSFEVPSMDSQQHVPLHLIVGAQDNHLGSATGYSL